MSVKSCHERQAMDFEHDEPSGASMMGCSQIGGLLTCRRRLRQPEPAWWTGHGRWMTWTRCCSAGSASATARRCCLWTMQAPTLSSVGALVCTTMTATDYCSRAASYIAILRSILECQPPSLLSRPGAILRLQCQPAAPA